MRVARDTDAGAWRTWAAEHDTEVRFASDVQYRPEEGDREALLDRQPGAFDPRRNPCVDFGRLEEHVPAMVLAPRTRDALRATLLRLRDGRTPYRIRGTAHSSGGQTLFAGGAIVELRHLDRVLAIEDSSEAITVEGGALWGTVAASLAAIGRRVPILTDNLQTTVAGTLAVGGFGDGSHLYGLQASTVERIELFTPDGAVHSLGTGDEMFAFALAGLGQLGVIGAATLRTIRRPRTLVARRVHFADLATFVTDLLRVTEHAPWDVVRARLVWRPDAAPFVEALVGRLEAAPALGAIDTSLLHYTPQSLTPPQVVDLLALMEQSQTEIDALAEAIPALEFSLPLPDGVAMWEELRRRLDELGVPATLRRGAAIVVAPLQRSLPWSPLSPSATHSLLVALRPRMSPSAARRLLPALASLADDVVALGGRIYLMSVGAIDPARLARQLGPAYERMRELKHRIDPDGLCNPGVFVRTNEPA